MENISKGEKQLSGRDRRFITWSKAAALAEKSGMSFERVLPTAIAMSGVPLSIQDIRGVQELQDRYLDIRNTILHDKIEGPPCPDGEDSIDGEAEVPEIHEAPFEPPPSVEDDVSADAPDRETQLVAARDRVIEYLHYNAELPCHALPFPKLGVTFFMVGKVTLDGDMREWNHNGKHGKFKALIPLCDSKIITLNGDTFPRAFFFEDWAWQVHEKEKRALCSGSLKIFCLKHEVNAEYICWVNPGGKGDPWRFVYKMTATGLSLTRFKLKADSKEDYIRLDGTPITVNPIDFSKIDFSVPKQR